MPELLQSLTTAAGRSEISSAKTIAPMKPERQKNWGDLRAPAWPLTFVIMHSQTITAIQSEGQC
jgi:hypothetical protein